MTRGDDEFADFARLSSGWLIQAAYLLTGDRLEAEELAQATLVRTYAAWPRVRRDGAHAYARTVLMNLTRDRWRRPLREQAAAEVPDRADSRDLADDVTTRRLLVELLDTLAPQERAVMSPPATEVANRIIVSVTTTPSAAANPPGRRKHELTTGSGVGGLLYTYSSGVREYEYSIGSGKYARIQLPSTLSWSNSELVTFAGGIIFLLSAPAS